MQFIVSPPKSLGVFHPATLVSTWFGIGLLRPASGTWGTIAALPFAMAILLVGGKVLLAAFTIAVFIAGVLAADIFEKAGEGKDPSSVVVDEVAGMWLTLLFVPFTLQGFLIAFILFRIFDILKIWPVSYADKELSGGFGIMADDILAALYAGGVSLFLLNFL